MAMGDRIARRGPWGAAPEAPPPPPAERRWHVAEGGGAKGPYTRDELAKMAAAGSIDRDTWLWTPGGPDWVRGRDVTELADLFSAPPPPPPA
jgi:hypothetical protein